MVTTVTEFDVPEGIPVTGVLTSDNGTMYFAGKKLIKITRGSIRLDNGIRLFRPSGTRIGSTYCTQQRVTGQITGALLHFGLIRFLMGARPGHVSSNSNLTYHLEPGILGADLVNSLLEKESVFPLGGVEDHFYPFKMDIEMVINEQRHAAMTEQYRDEKPVDAEYWADQSIIAKNCIINTYPIVYNNNGHIISGPINFIGSAVQWKHNLV